MNFEKVLDFYRRAISEGRISEELLSDAKAISDEVELKKFMEEKLLPIAKDMGFEITEEDLISYEKDAVKHLSEEEMESVIGGLGVKSWALGGLLSVAAILGGAAALNTSHAMKPGGPPPAATSVPVRANQTQTKTKVVTGDTPGHSGTFTCTYNFGTHQGTLTLKRADGVTDSQVFYFNDGFSVDRFLTNAEIGLKKGKSATAAAFCRFQANDKNVISLSPPVAQPKPQAVKPAQPKPQVAKPGQPLAAQPKPQTPAVSTSASQPTMATTKQVTLPHGRSTWGAVKTRLEDAKKKIDAQKDINALAGLLVDTRKALVDIVIKPRVYTGTKLPQVADAIRKGTADGLDKDGNGQGTTDSAKTFVRGVFDLALRMEGAFPQKSIQLLNKGPQEVVFSREQCACIIAGGVLGILAKTEETKEFDFGLQMDRGDGFGQLFPGSVHYLYRYITAKNHGTPFKGNVKIRRIWGKELTVADMNHPLCNVEISTDKKIEFYKEAIQADFANSSIGGGALGPKGCVQEEIRFGMVSPECLVSMYLAKASRMADLETICIEGAEAFSSYTGYAAKTRWQGDVRDDTSRTSDGSVHSCVVAMDAMNKPGVKEFKPVGFNRDMNKAYTAFSFLPEMHGRDVATGLWGCGDFSCSVELKFLQQWIACSCCPDPTPGHRRTMNFCCYLNEEAAKTCNGIMQWVNACQIKDAAYLYRVVMDYCQFMTENFGDVIMSYPQFWVYLGERFGMLERKYCLTKEERLAKEERERAAQVRGAHGEIDTRYEPPTIREDSGVGQYRRGYDYIPSYHRAANPDAPDRQMTRRFSDYRRDDWSGYQEDDRSGRRDYAPGPSVYRDSRTEPPKTEPSESDPSYRALRLRGDSGLKAALAKKSIVPSESIYVRRRNSTSKVAYNLSGDVRMIRQIGKDEYEIINLETGKTEAISWGDREVRIYDYDARTEELTLDWESYETEF